MESSVSLTCSQVLVFINQFNDHFSYETSSPLVDAGHYFTYGCLVPLVVNVINDAYLNTHRSADVRLAGHIPDRDYCPHCNELLPSRNRIIAAR